MREKVSLGLPCGFGASLRFAKLDLGALVLLDLGREGIVRFEHQHLVTLCDLALNVQGVFHASEPSFEIAYALQWIFAMAVHG
jgi:hypothetical protein